MKFIREYNDLDKFLKPNKALIIYGARRIGKTTLINDYLKKTKKVYKLDSGDFLSTRDVLGSEDLAKLKDYCQGYELLIIDEAQKIPNIGSGFKIILDYIKNIQIIATGSSSFTLAGQIGEPLVGRKKSLMMYPISILGLSNDYNNFELAQKLDEFLIFGMYPDVLTEESRNEKISYLNETVQSYLLKDILELERIKNSKILIDLLRLLAFQVGGEVSISEISTKLGIDFKTSSRYIDLLEKSFILFNLRGYSRNLREEVTKKSKYYFYDNGILNAILSNFNSIEIREDVGRLWENFLVVERLKKLGYQSISSNLYFWRTWQGKELDWIEERDGTLYGFEFKFSKNQSKHGKFFKDLYPNSEVKVINKDNFLEFVM